MNPMCLVQISNPRQSVEKDRFDLSLWSPAIPHKAQKVFGGVVKDERTFFLRAVHRLPDKATL